eukprot:5320683-Pyramimonas_sp.AAC.1
MTISILEARLTELARPSTQAFAAFGVEPQCLCSGRRSRRYGIMWRRRGARHPYTHSTLSCVSTCERFKLDHSANYNSHLRSNAESTRPPD